MFVGLRDIRAANNITAEQMATVIGLKTKSAYYKKEAGKIKFTLDEAKKISDYLMIPMEDIFFNDNVSIIETKSSKRGV